MAVAVLPLLQIFIQPVLRKWHEPLIIHNTAHPRRRSIFMFIYIIRIIVCIDLLGKVPHKVNVDRVIASVSLDSLIISIHSISIYTTTIYMSLSHKMGQMSASQCSVFLYFILN